MFTQKLCTVHLLDKRTKYTSQMCIGKISLMSPIVINVPTRALLAVETKGLFVPVVGKFELQNQCL